MKKKSIRSLLAVFVILLTLAGCTSEPTVAPLAVTILKVGKADAIIVCTGPHTLLIDAGEEDDGQEITEFLRKRSISEIDAMIITHFDQDHVGGADTVLEQFPVKSVYVPAYEGTHPEYLDFLMAAESAGVSPEHLTAPVSFRLGDADILIEPPRSYEIPDAAEDYDNNFSLITTIRHGEMCMVFMGDAEKPRIRQWLADSQPGPCDFLKVPHHGIYNKALEELFSTLSPQYAVICSSRKNPADTKTLELLKQFCPNVFETKDGNVTVISNGKKLEILQKIKK